MHEIVLAVPAVGLGFALALTDSGKGRRIWRELRETGPRWGRRPPNAIFYRSFCRLSYRKGLFRSL